MSRFSISYPDRVPECRCAICGRALYHGDDCFDTDIGPICKYIPAARRKHDRSGFMRSVPCIFSYIMDISDIEEAADLFEIPTKAWAEDRTYG